MKDSIKVSMMNINKYPLVSVLMTAYNREKYIAEAIESILASTYQNWELIVVDDCSEDKTLAIARGYEQADSRIKVFVNEKNLGDYPNRNKAASYAKGKYLKYLDSDDIMYPHCLDVLVAMMEKEKSAALGIPCPRYKADAPYPKLLSSREVYIEEFFRNGIFTSGPTGTIIRKDCFIRLGGFKAIRHDGDIEFWLRLSAVYSIVVVPSELCWWRVHSGQENKLRNDRFSSMSIRFMAIENELNPLNKSEKNAAAKILKWKYSRGVLLVLKKLNLKKFHFYFKASSLSFLDLFYAIITSKNKMNKVDIYFK